MPLAELEAAFEKPFLPAELGGCPALPPVFREQSRPLPPRHSRWRGLGAVDVRLVASAGELAPDEPDLAIRDAARRFGEATKPKRPVQELLQSH